MAFELPSVLPVTRVVGVEHRLQERWVRNLTRRKQSVGTE